MRGKLLKSETQKWQSQWQAKKLVSGDFYCGDPAAVGLLLRIVTVLR